jgi:hypothetical protein
LTLHFDFAAMQIDAALYNHQTKARPRSANDILPPMEGAEEPLSIGFWNADPLVEYGADDLCSSTFNFEPHQPTNVRILDRVTQQISENMSHQTLVGVNLKGRFGKR